MLFVYFKTSLLINLFFNCKNRKTMATAFKDSLLIANYVCPSYLFLTKNSKHLLDYGDFFDYQINCKFTKKACKIAKMRFKHMLLGV